MRLFALAALLIGALIVTAPHGGRTPVVDACAFATPPTTYETTDDRGLYLTAMDLAGHDMLFPRDLFFSQKSIDIGLRNSRTASEDIYVPPTLLKAISWIESVITQGAPGLPFGSIGPALVSCVA